MHIPKTSGRSVWLAKDALGSLYLVVDDKWVYWVYWTNEKTDTVQKVAK